MELLSTFLSFYNFSCAEFCDQHNHPFLLAVNPEGDQSESFLLQTAELIPSRDPLLRSSEGFRIDYSSDLPVYRVKKKMGTPFASRITIGRLETSDIVLQDGTVSKLHAYFTLEKDGYHLNDAKSRNGTRLNDAKLEPGESRVVSYGDVIRVGLFSLRYVASETIYEAMQRIVIST